MLLLAHRKVHKSVRGIRQQDVEELERYASGLIPAPLHQQYQAEYDRRAAVDWYGAERWLTSEARDWQGRGNEAAFHNWLERCTGTVGQPGTVDGDLRALADEATRVAGGLLLDDGNAPELAAILTEFPGVQIEGQDNAAQAARLKCTRVWRRKLRVKHARELEAQHRADGAVSRRAGLYVSDEAVELTRAQWKRNRGLLELIEATNDEGMSATLAELSDKGVSNPANRRAELMVRIRGFEEVAKVACHVGMFYTLTAPSAYHRTHHHGRPNGKWNGSTPRETQAYLSKVWARVRAEWKREGIAPYGFRIAEPHHDGTPHWHLLLFMPAAQREATSRIFSEYACQEAPQEIRRNKAVRFKAVRIDWSRGSAAGYVAKYVSKNIDGRRADGAVIAEKDFEGADTLAEGAERVRAWASVWGIRQFQQIGKAPVTLWRELRRLARDLGEDKLTADTAHAPTRLAYHADRAEWAAFVNDPGRALVDLHREPAPANRYGEEGGQAIKGVAYNDGDSVQQVFVTRYRKWVFEVRARPAPAWTGVNNCTEERPKHGKNRRTQDHLGRAEGSQHVPQSRHRGNRVGSGRGIHGKPGNPYRQPRKQGGITWHANR